MRLALVDVALIWAMAAGSAAAQDQRGLGIVPFDVSSVEGNGADAGRVLATLVRVEMLKNPVLLPQLVALPEGVRLPLATKDAASLGRDSNVEFLVVGTVLEATTTHRSNRASSSRLGGIAGGVVSGVSGSLSRSTAKVSLHLQLINSASGAVEAFEVEASNTDVGVGADFWTALGGFGTGDDGWQKTPMGKALRQAAEKVTAEVARRAAKTL